jgi:hypothetical protein
MSVESVIDFFLKIVKEKEAHKSEYRQKQEEETKVLEKKKLKKVESVEVLNILLLVVRSSLYSPSF